MTPAFVGEDDGLDAVAEVELGEDAGDVALHGGLAEVEVAAISALDRPRARSRRTSSSRALSVGDRAGRPAAGRRAAAEVFDQAAGDRGREQRIACSDRADGGGELLAASRP